MTGDDECKYFPGKCAECSPCGKNDTYGFPCTRAFIYTMLSIGGCGVLLLFFSLFGLILL